MAAKFEKNLELNRKNGNMVDAHIVYGKLENNKRYIKDIDSNYIQGKLIDSKVPKTGEILKYDGAKWTPENIFGNSKVIHLSKNGAGSIEKNTSHGDSPYFASISNLPADSWSMKIEIVGTSENCDVYAVYNVINRVTAATTNASIYTNASSNFKSNGALQELPTIDKATSGEIRIKQNGSGVGTSTMYFNIQVKYVCINDTNTDVPVLAWNDGATFIDSNALI